MVKSIKVEEFQDLVALGFNGVVEFMSATCAPCRAMSPVLEHINEEFGGSKIYAIDADANRELAAVFNVRSVPTLVFFKEGNETHRITGIANKKAIVEGLKK